MGAPKSRSLVSETRSLPHRGKPRGAEFVRDRGMRARGQHEVRFSAGLAELAQGFGRERGARGPGDADDDFHG